MDVLKESGRKPLSQRIRFKIFERDRFTCKYCGRSAPEVKLEIDHIHPVCKGGNDSESNLTTACVGCNRGKSGTPLAGVAYPLEEFDGSPYEGMWFFWRRGADKYLPVKKWGRVLLKLPDGRILVRLWNDKVNRDNHPLLYGRVMHRRIPGHSRCFHIFDNVDSDNFEWFDFEETWRQEFIEASIAYSRHEYQNLIDQAKYLESVGVDEELQVLHLPEFHAMNLCGTISELKEEAF